MKNKLAKKIKNDNQEVRAAHNYLIEAYSELNNRAGYTLEEFQQIIIDSVNIMNIDEPEESESKIDIEEKICPDAGKVFRDGEACIGSIVDAELDVLKCTFHNDLSVKIDTDKLSYICLDINNLHTLIDMVVKVEEGVN